MKKLLIGLVLIAVGLLILIISGICTGGSVNLIAVSVCMALVIPGVILVLSGGL